MRIVTCLATEHNLLLVALAALICSIGAWVAIRLLRRARGSDRNLTLAWIFLGGVASGSAVWCTHFVAMLAFESQAPVSYEPGLTAFSLLVVVLASSAAFAFATLRFPFAVEIGGAVFGAGVAAMHYTGMAAFMVDGVVQWDGIYLAVSLAFAVAAASLAFNRAFAPQAHWDNGGAAAVLVAAVVGLHFTGMAAMTIVPYAPLEGATTSATARHMLAFAVAAVAALVLGIVWVINVVDRVLNEQSDARLRYLAGSSADGVVIAQDGNILEVNAAFEAIIGIERNSLIGKPISDAHLDADSLADGEIVRATLEPQGGAAIAVEIAAHSETDKSGRGALRVYAVRDIRPRLEQERRIAKLARSDQLTGLPNRAAFLERLDNAIADRSEDGIVGLLAIDLNRFKEVNDLHGHAAGDTVLRVLSERMKGVLNDGEFIARLGGDEFVALCSATDRQGVVDLAERLEVVLFSTVEIEQADAVCGGSIGIALYPDHASTATALMNNADLAMYRAKASLHDNICFYAEDMDEAVRSRRRMIADLRTALARDEFELHYQVQMDVRRECATGYEALLRWRHPERGFIPPSEFIPVAEETGLIVQIGAWVLRKACEEAMNWSSDLTIAVNLSAVQVTHDDLVETVEKILAETGLPASRLEFETTETSLMKDPARAQLVLAQLKALGVSIAIDDFGTGYSSLSTLRTFNFDKIKLDKSFVDGIEVDMQAQAVMLAVIALGKALAIPVLAEGVETSYQLDFLRSRGCGRVQGYLYGRPQPSVQGMAERSVA